MICDRLLGYKHTNLASLIETDKILQQVAIKAALKELHIP